MGGCQPWGRRRVLNRLTGWRLLARIGSGSLVVRASTRLGTAVMAGGTQAVARAGMPLWIIWVSPRRATLARMGAGTAVRALASTSGFAAGMWMHPRPAALLFLLVRVPLHAPRLSRHRILVTPPPAWRLWTSMCLADAVCCLLGRSWRSVHLRVIYTLGFFRAFLIYAFNLSEPAWATATMVLILVILIAPLPPSPMGWAGGASSGARTTAPPAAVAAATRITAGTLVTNCTGTRTSSRTVGHMGRGV